MAKIVYGVSGEGSGHSSRARELARHLLAGGHDVRLVSYDRGYRNLSSEFQVFETEGLTIASRDNRVSIVQTFTENLARMPEGHRKLQALRRELFKDFQPDCVITDFEPMTAYLAAHYSLPLISVDNQHRMRYVEFDVPPGLETDWHLTRNVIRLMVPRPDVCLVTTFCPGTARNDFTFQFPPIVALEALQQSVSDGDRILVYVTSGFETLVDLLRGFRREKFIVYGTSASGSEGNMTFKQPDRAGFLADLGQAQAVVATAGFTLISEALAMHKPYLAAPMEGQFEQELNGFQLESMGFGKNGRRPEGDTIAAFLYQLPDYRDKLAAYAPGDSSGIKAKLDELLADDCRLLRQFQAQRH
ncbi:MAG: glycosyltransferase family protein [Pirellulales bacterium]